mmetsp:Transcript_34928/g.87987  ORF Transcript_34928/g.87987 Transcript_34928/m.87987 type:complete len:233 (+) Transcript_34928:195-893(+)
MAAAAVSGRAWCAWERAVSEPAIMFAVPRALPVGPPDRSLGGGRGCGGHRLVVGDLRRSGRRLAESFGDLLTKRHPASLQLGEDQAAVVVDLKRARGHQAVVDRVAQQPDAHAVAKLVLRHRLLVQLRRLHPDQRENLVAGECECQQPHLRESSELSECHLCGCDREAGGDDLRPGKLILDQLLHLHESTLVGSAAAEGDVHLAADAGAVDFLSRRSRGALGRKHADNIAAK